MFHCSGFQKQDGIQGAMVVRRPSSLEPNSHLYDYDLASHVIFVSDWMKSSAGEHLPGLETHDTFQNPDSILLNGRGRNLVSTALVVTIQWSLANHGLNIQSVPLFKNRNNKAGCHNSGLKVLWCEPRLLQLLS